MKKAIINIIVALLLLLIAASVVFMFTTETGLRISVNIAKDLLPGELHVAQLQGRLIGPISAQEITYIYNQREIAIQNFKLDWQPFELLNDRIKIHSLSATKVNVIWPNETKETEESISLPTWPAALRIQQISLPDVRYQTEKDGPVVHFSAQGGAHEQWQLQWKLLIQNLNMFHEKARGQLSIIGHITGPISQPKIQAQAITKNLFWGETAVEKLQANLGLQLVTSNHVNFNLNLSGMQIKQKKMSPLAIIGQVELKHHKWKTEANAQLPLANLTTFIPQIEHPQGTLTVKAILQSKHHPQLFAELNNAQITLSDNNITLKNIQLKINSKNNVIDYQASAQSGQGQLSITGATKFHKEHAETTLTINGTHFLVHDTKDLQIYVTPSLKVNAKNHKLYVTGTVFVPKARVTPKEFNNSVTMPDDTVYISQKKTDKQSPPWQLHSNIKLLLGSDVKLVYRGLTGKLVGGIQLIDEPQRPTIARGQIRMKNGTFDLAGNSLNIEKANLNFLGGPVSNPNVNANASRKIVTSAGVGALSFANRTITVGINITGTVKNPKFTFFSTPGSLSQADILSYLIMGKPANSLTGSNADVLLQAAKFLNSKGSNNMGLASLAGQVQKTLGLSTLTVGSDSKNDNGQGGFGSSTSLVLGKYLSPRLYVSYSIGLLSHLSTIRINYHVSKHWTLQGESSQQGNGIDAIYTIDRK